MKLEEKISEWRQQMLAAGIKTPVPLEELEIHLREEIGQQTKLRLNELEAFELAVKKIGPIPVLKTEFTRSESWWGDGNSTKTNRILGVIWTASSLWPFCAACFLLLYVRSPEALTLHFALDFCFYAATLLGGILLFRGSSLGRYVIRSLALILLIACVAQISVRYGSAQWLAWCGLWAIVSLMTIVLLHLHLPGLVSAKQWSKLNSLGIIATFGAIIVGAQLQMYTDSFISIHRNGIHGAIILHWPVFLMLLLNFIGVVCLVWSMRRSRRDGARIQKLF